MSSIEIVLTTLLAVSAIIAWYYVFIVLKDELALVDTIDVGASRSSFPIGEWDDITVLELAQIEGSIHGLIRVIVAAHRFEDPTNELREAVKRNIERGVEYQFLVSAQHAADELHGWVLSFLSIAQVILKRADSPRSPHDVVRMSRLTYSWRDTPYVFYQTKTSNGRLATVAFRGHESDEGICNEYTRLPGWLAYSLANAILSDAPEPMRVEAPQFMVAPEVDEKVIGRIGTGEQNYAG
ncbi:MAG: hypothetical protein ACF8PN_09880 [Phycisphaerales bacterium]